jgi:hypothetical protein
MVGAIMAKLANVEVAINSLYMELGKEAIRSRLATLEIERLTDAGLSTEHTVRRAGNIEAKRKELEDGLLIVVLSTKLKGSPLLHQ